MEIGEPVTTAQIPSVKGRKGSKYDELFAAVDRLDPDQWLPVTMENERMGQRLIEIAKYRGYRRKRRGLVVYMAKEDTNATQS